MSNCQVKNVPDLWVAGGGRAAWIEIKWFPKPIGPWDTPFKSYSYFTAGQQKWIEDAVKYTDQDGAFLLVGSPGQHTLLSGAGINFIRIASCWESVLQTACITSKSLTSFASDWRKYWDLVPY